MKINITSSKFFNDLKDVEKIKEFYAVFGLLIFEYTLFEGQLTKLIHGHWLMHQNDDKGHPLTKEKAETLWQEKLARIETRTLNFVIEEFRRIYFTDEFDNIIDRIKDKRDHYIHQQMKNKPPYSDKVAFKNLYQVMENEVNWTHNAILSFRGVKFITRADNKKGVRWK